MLDLTNREQMIQYLLDKGIINEKDGYSAEYCKGGISCITALVEVPGKTMLIKQGREKLAVKEDWRADPARLAIETKATIVYNQIVPESAPNVLSYDSENFVMIRDAAPADCSMWKSDIMNGIFDFEVARKTMEALAKVHNRCHMDSKLAEKFKDTSIFYQLRISPLIEFVVEKYPDLAEIGGRLKKRLLETKTNLVHADYTPKNILVKKDRSICILDYEISHFGDPAYDLGLFTAHIVLKSAYLEKYSAAVLNMLVHMTDTYFSTMNYSDPVKLEESCMEILGMMMIARIDSKSPVEYITCDNTKQLVRNMAKRLLSGEVKTYRQAAAVFLEMEKNAGNSGCIIL